MMEAENYCYKVMPFDLKSTGAPINDSWIRFHRQRLRGLCIRHGGEISKGRGPRLGYSQSFS